ncbi:MAG: collagen-binding domain-containing protein [Limisphaerales bacterium]
MKKNRIILACVAAAATFQASAALTMGDDALGDAANYAVLYEGSGSHHFTINGTQVNGNIGIGDPSGATTAKLQLNGPVTISGNVNFAGTVNDNGPYSGNVSVSGSIAANNTTVQTDLANLNTLSSTLGAESGTALTVNLNNNQSQTINANSGTLDAYGNRVFTVNSFNFGNGATLTISGNGSQPVVLNFSSAASFGGTILVTGGITSDQVLFNVTGGSGLAGGNGLYINSGATLTGTFLDPNGAITMGSSVLNGRLFGGGSQDESLNSGSDINAPTPVPEPGTILAGALLLLPFGASTVRVLRRGRAA